MVRATEIVRAFPGEEGLRDFRKWVLSPDYDLIADAAAPRAVKKKRGAAAAATAAADAGAEAGAQDPAGAPLQMLLTCKTLIILVSTRWQATLHEM